VVRVLRTLFPALAIPVSLLRNETSDQNQPERADRGRPEPAQIRGWRIPNDSFRHVEHHVTKCQNLPRI